jgi:vitamin B12 transporter
MLALSLMASFSRAQEQEPSRAAPPPRDADTHRSRVRSPELLEFVEAEYPPEAIESRREGRVVLRLTIDGRGQVTAAEVTESAGSDFDQAAQQAALRFRFLPAYRGEQPIAARILYAYEFRLPLVDRPGLIERPPLQPSAYEPKPPERIRHSVSPRPVTPSAAPIEVEVRGPSHADRLRQSAQAVNVVETEQAQRQTADLGEVLARSEGVGVRRSGGLGSSARFSLNGLTDDQIRFFIDTVPLELAGFPFGISNVPVNLVERVEIYRGVVPVRFGADALGGAVNLVTSEAASGSHGSASYQVGSFGTYRLTASAQHQHEPSGFVASLGSFVDYAENNYPVDVEVADPRGPLSPARVHRFHDAYRAAGGQVELGFVKRPWAKHLLLRAFVTAYEKELQHDAVMIVPYGAVTYGETTRGGSLRYDRNLGRGVRLDALAGYTSTTSKFLDVSRCRYDWFGRCIRERERAGEIESEPYDRIHWEKTGFARIVLSWLPIPAHTARLSIAPTFVTRTGDERRQFDPDARDPLTAKRDLFTLVSGLEHELRWLDDRLENIAFAKQYLQVARSEEPAPGDIFRRRDRDTLRFGVGDALRYRFVESVYAKASYEFATRMPRADETFGDAALILANLELEPERSHNFNLGLSVDVRDISSGSYRTEVTGFLREAEQLIVLLGNARFLSYQNVFGARSVGVEAAAGWTAPGDHLALDGNVTYLDFRNTSTEGTFGAFADDRIPNRPYLFATGTADLRFADVAAANDEISLAWSTRYVHEFFRSWESVALLESKQVVPSQLLHSLAATYVLRRALTISSTLEVQNLTDEATFDFFGAQRPGRAYYFKGTAEF